MHAPPRTKSTTGNARQPNYNERFGTEHNKIYGRELTVKQPGSREDSHYYGNASEHFAQTVVGFILAVLVTGCAEQHYRASPQTVGELADPLTALMAIQRSTEERGGSFESCLDQNGHGLATVSFSGEKIQIICKKDGRQRIVRYREAPEVEAISHGNNFGHITLHRRDGTAQRVIDTVYWPKFESAKEFADAWYVLAQPRQLRDPATDAVFLDAVKRYQANPKPYEEALRRVQIQVENAIKEHNVLEAATFYRDALKTAVGWPEGHFNLALLLSELDFYPDAINEMRRYLYLIPAAPDTRAAQDKIYEWERKAKSEGSR